GGDASSDRPPHSIGERVDLVQRRIHVWCDADAAELRMDDRRIDDLVFVPEPGPELEWVEPVHAHHADRSTFLARQRREDLYPIALGGQRLGPPIPEVAQARDLAIDSD